MFFLSLSSYALIPVTPDFIDIPKQIKKRSPEHIKLIFSSLEKQYNTKSANLWKLQYHKAILLKKTDRDFFCQIMKDLAEAPLFPLKDLALIHSYELCPYSEEPSFDPESFPRFLRLKLAEALYKRRKLFKDPERTFQTAVYLSKKALNKDLRVSFIKQSLFLARTQKKQKEIKPLNQLLYKEAIRFKPRPSEKDYFLIAKDFKQARKFKKAIAFYVKTLNSPRTSFKEKNFSFKGLNHIYKIQRKSKKRLRNSRQWSTWLLKENTEQSLKMYYNRRLDLAKQQWNLDNNKRAIQLITAILKNKKSKSIWSESFYLRGLIYAQEKQNDLSFKDLDQAMKFIQKDDERLLEKILWKKAWALRIEKKYKKALDSFKLLERITKSPYTKYKILFWKGRTLQSLDENFLALRVFQQLIAKNPYGYYGLVARKIIGKKPKFKKHKRFYSISASSMDKKKEDLIHWLILFKEFKLLAQFLDTEEDQFFKQKKRTKKDWLNLSLLYTKGKKYLELFQFLEKMGNHKKNSFLNKHIRLLFPLDFFIEIEGASNKWAVSKALILAIIRQESAFQIRARSPADAFGLMQLIPSTARQIARKSKTSYRNFRDLYRPSKNIFLGTAYLKELLNYYNNNFLFSVSSYNAGSTPVKKWKEDMKNHTALEFIDSIPYEETRVYVRLVIRNYIFYHNYIKTKEDAWFPDWILQ